MGLLASDPVVGAPMRDPESAPIRVLVRGEHSLPLGPPHPTTPPDYRRHPIAVGQSPADSSSGEFFMRTAEAAWKSETAKTQVR